VLFICVHNAGRSQMAEAFFNKLSEGRHRGISGGSNPASQVNPVAVEAMSRLALISVARNLRNLIRRWFYRLT